jgi:hypothetical protein
MTIKNYTTSVSSIKTIGEIQSLLARKGAAKIMTEYDKNGEANALCFILVINGGEFPFALPIRVEAIYKVLEGERKKGKLPKSLLSQDQAKRIGWRILKDWVDSQLALVEIGMAQMEEVFMPYLYNPLTKKTLYEVSAGRQFQNLLPSVTG